MAEHPERRLHPIRLLHVLGCLGLAVVMGGYAWRNAPLRRVWVTAPRAHRNRARTVGFQPLVPAVLQERLRIAQACLPDLLGGMSVFLLVSLGTGVYARRLEVWLEAHQAGEAASIRGLGLDRAALGANKDRKRGANL
jgi:hypothetical protein